MFNAVVYIFQAHSYSRFIDNNGHVDYTRSNIHPPQKSDFFLPLLADAWDSRIATVVSAGNRPELHLGDSTPQRFGREDNPLITVGSIDKYGLESSFTTQEGDSSDGRDPLLTGHITVFAQGQEVETARPYGDESNRFIVGSGTSLSAPQVGGLAAYFAGEPGGGPFTAMGIKTKILDYSRGGDADDGRYLINNGVQDLLCSPESPRKSRRKLKQLSVREKVKLEVARQNKDQNPRVETVFANGQLQSSKFAELVSPLDRKSVV